MYQNAGARGVISAGCLLLGMAAAAGNLLPDADFELDTTYRSYGIIDPRHPAMAPRFDMLEAGAAWSGQRCLRVDGAAYNLTSPLVHAAPGVHTFSFYARVAGGIGTIRAGLRADPARFGHRLPATNAVFRITDGAWRRYTLTWDLPASRDNWYSVMLNVTPPSNGAVLLDAWMLEPGACASGFAPARPLESALFMAGDFSRVFPASAPLPPLRIQTVNHGISARITHYELAVRDFWQRTVWETNLQVETPGAARVDTAVVMPIDRKGPFRVELYARGGAMLDELVFGIVPDITNRVLATQHGNPDPALAYFCRTLGFSHGGVTAAAGWGHLQPAADTPVADWSWATADHYLRGIADYMPNKGHIWLYWFPDWAVPKARKTKLFDGQAPGFPYAGFLDYIEAVARRYPDWKLMQVWNEPYYWPAEEYVRLLALCRERLDRVNPDIRIVAPTIHPRSTEWMERFLAAGGLRYCDIFAVHAYPSVGGFSVDTLEMVRRWAWHDGNTNRPLWNTETSLQPIFIASWYTMLRAPNTGGSRLGAVIPDANTAEEGAERWVRLYLLQTAMGIQRFFSHVAPQPLCRESALPRITGSRHAEPDGSRPPVALAWAVAGHRVGDWRGGGVHDLSPHLRALVFHKAERTQVVLWTMDHENQDILDPVAAGLYHDHAESQRLYRGRQRRIIDRAVYPLAVVLDADKITVYDMFDNPIIPERLDGRMVLPVSCRPLYLESELPFEKLRAALTDGELTGLSTFQAWIGMGVDAGGAPAVLVKTASCVPSPLSLRGEIVSPELEFSNTVASLRLQPLRERALAFTLAGDLPKALDGTGVLSVAVVDGVSTQVVTKSPLWMLAAPYRRDIEMDGDLADWKDASALNMNRREQAIAPEGAWSGPEDCSAAVMAAWNEESLYIAARVADDVFTDKRGYAGDALELFFDCDLMGDIQDSEAGADDLHYTVNPPVGDNWPAGELRAKGCVDGGVVFGRRTSAGYDLEIAIPMEHLRAAGFQPRNNAALGFCPAVCDHDRDSFFFKMVWTGNARINMDPTGMGWLCLTGRPESGPVSGADWGADAVSAWRFNDARRLRDLGSMQADGMVMEAGYRDDPPDGPRLVFDVARKSQVRFLNAQYDLPRKTLEIEFTCLNTNPVSELLWNEPAAQGWRYHGIIDETGSLLVCLVDYHNQSQTLLRSRTRVRAPGAWFTAAYQWDAAARNMRLFINGKLEDAATHEIQTITRDISIGGASDENRWFTGAVRRARILDRCLYPAADAAGAGEPGFHARYDPAQLGGGILPDTGPLQIDAACIGTFHVVRDPAHGAALAFNGVDNMLWFPVGFCGPRDRIRFWICPADAPGESPALRFRERLGKNEREDQKFIRFSMDADGNPDWGVVTATTRRFASRMTGNRYVFAADSPAAGYRLQAWLEPEGGRLFVRYLDPASGRRLSLASRSAVWRKDIWNHVELQFDARARQMRLLINYALEDQVDIPVPNLAGQWPSFSLGGSKRDGPPFYGLLAGIEFLSDLAPGAWLLPAGTFAFGEQDFGAGLRLPAGCEPIGLVAPDDQAGLAPDDAGRGKILQIRTGTPGRGMALAAGGQGVRRPLTLSVQARADQAADMRLLLGKTSNPENAFIVRSFTLNSEWQTLTISDIAADYPEFRVILIFDQPGTYNIRTMQLL